MMMMMMMYATAATFLLCAVAVAQLTPAIILDNVSTDLDYALVDSTRLVQSHVLVYNQACANDPLLTEKPKFYGFQYRLLSESAEQQVFSSPSSDHCRAACIERGTDAEVAHAVMPQKQYDASTSKSPSFTNWFQQTCHRVEVCLMNYHDPDRLLPLQWITADGTPRDHIQLGYGERNTKCFHSFLGHSFRAIDPVDPTVVVAEFTVEYTTVLALGSRPPPDDRETRSFDQEIRSTLVHEWDRHHRVPRTFSPLGFAKGRLPEDVFASMRSFFHNNRGNTVMEEWGGRGVFVNWWQVDCAFLQIPWELKRQWQLRLLELVQAWAGVEIEQTDMYGLRQYQEGARLLTHVDRIATHSVSLIVNIAQGNLTAPWPVEVHDHHDRLHEVPMRPGDIVYYESAKCLHGRNRPLEGQDAYYVNLFTHYRPTGDPEWFAKPNHEGAPAPILGDVEGSCRLQPDGLTERTDGTLGTVQSLHCDDPRLGPYVSPTLFTATSGKDLIDWWERTAPGVHHTTIGGSSSGLSQPAANPVCTSTPPDAGGEVAAAASV